MCLKQSFKTYEGKTDKVQRETDKCIVGDFISPLLVFDRKNRKSLMI